MGPDHGHTLIVPLIVIGLFVLPARAAASASNRSQDPKRRLLPCAAPHRTDALDARSPERPDTGRAFHAAANRHYYATRDPLVWQAFTPRPYQPIFGRVVGFWLADLWVGWAATR